MAWSGTRIRAAREAAGLTRAQLAVAISRTEHSVLCYEIDLRAPTVHGVVVIAKVLGIHPGELFDDDPERVDA